MLKNLEELKSNIHFEMPENDYFEGLQEDLFKKIHQRKRDLRLRTILYSTSIAASFLIIFTIIQFLPSEKDSQLAQLTEETTPINPIAIEERSIDEPVIDLPAQEPQQLALSEQKSIPTKKAVETSVPLMSDDDETSFQVAAYYEEELADLSNFDTFCY